MSESENNIPYPFHAASGTLWEYTFVYERRMFILLDGYVTRLQPSGAASTEQHVVTFRRMFDVTHEHVNDFSCDSHVNETAKLL